MATVGADLETLRNLHKGLGEHAQKAHEIKTGLDSHFANAVWTGTNADKTRQAWQDFKPHLERLHTTLTDAQTAIKHQHNNLSAATGESVTI